ncbi:MAG: PD-(D/E)XK nuclease domain-containing protein, partial [Butyricimonas faecihominis]
KLDGSADQALAQIDDRGYLIPYTVDGRKLVKIGVNFDPAQRNIGDWKREDKN